MHAHTIPAIEPHGVFVDGWGALPAGTRCRGDVAAPPEAIALFDTPADAPLDARLAEGGALHESAVVELCRRFAEGRARDDIALVYVHRGHAPRWRTPVLLGLLARIPPFGCVEAVRATTQALPLEALVLAVAHVAAGRACLVLDDGAERLAPADAPEAGEPAVRHLAFAAGRGRHKLLRIAFDEIEGGTLCPIAVSDAFGRKATLHLSEDRHDHSRP